MELNGFVRSFFLEENMEIVIVILVGLFAYATFKIAKERIGGEEIER